MKLPLESLKYDAEYAFSDNTRPEVCDKALAEGA
jgi:hypothetical protein